MATRTICLILVATLCAHVLQSAARDLPSKGGALDTGRNLQQADCQVGVYRWLIWGQQASPNTTPFCELELSDFYFGHACGSLYVGSTFPTFAPISTPTYETAPANTSTTTTGGLYNFQNPSGNPLFCEARCAADEDCAYVTAVGTWCYAKTKASAFKSPSGQDPGRTSYHINRAVRTPHPDFGTIATCTIPSNLTSNIPVRQPPIIDCIMTDATGFRYKCNGCGQYYFDTAGQAVFKCIFNVQASF